MLGQSLPTPPLHGAPRRGDQAACVPPARTFLSPQLVAPACPHSPAEWPSPVGVQPWVSSACRHGCPGTQSAPVPPAPTAHLLGQASLAQAYTLVALSSFGGAPRAPPSSTWGSLLSSTIVPTGVGYSVREQRRGEAGRGAAPATSLPGVQPCSRRVLHRVHWKGAPPQPARSARRLHRALARQRCSQRSVSKKPADARHPFPLLRLSFPYFWARNLLPEPLPPPPHPSWRPACVPRI